MPTPPSGLGELLGTNVGRNRSGTDLSHFIGDAHWRNNLGDFLSLSPDYPSNPDYQPATRRGAATMNVSRHANHVQAINDIVMGLITDPVTGDRIPDPNSSKYLNVLYRGKQSARAEAIRLGGTRFRASFAFQMAM